MIFLLTLAEISARIWEIPIKAKGRSPKGRPFAFLRIWAGQEAGICYNLLRMPILALAHHPPSVSWIIFSCLR